MGLKGVTSDVTIVTFLAFPSATDPARCDTAVVNGFVGLRRVRPGATVQFSSVKLEASTSRTSLGGAPLLSESPLLEEYCSSPALPLIARHQGRVVTYELADMGVGPRTAVDVFTTEFYPANHPRYRDASKPGKRWCYSAVDHPTKALLFDFLLHEDMWPGSEPELRLYDTAIHGSADPNDPQRDKDRLDLAEAIAPLGHGMQRFRGEDVPNYMRLLGAMFERVRQDGQRFRGYRSRINYPFYGSQVCMLFDPPEAPGTKGR